jgi:hypothetical protein
MSWMRTSKASFEELREFTFFGSGGWVLMIEGSVEIGD